MAPKRKMADVSDQVIQDALNKGGNITEAARMLGCHRKTVAEEMEIRGLVSPLQTHGIMEEKESGWKEIIKGNEWMVDLSGDALEVHRINNVEDVVKKLNIDLTVWRIARIEATPWDTTMKLREFDESGKSVKERPFKTQNQRLKVVFERIVPKSYEDVADKFLERIAKHSPKVPRGKYPALKTSKNKRGEVALEVAVMDPHLGLNCFRPGSDGFWSPEQCKQMMVEIVARSLDEAKKFGPFTEIVFPFGNDYLHADNLQHTTTAGTAQPESQSWHKMYLDGETVAIELVDMMRSVAPVRIIQVPGNHDRQSAFTLGRILNAWYRNDANVTVEADCSPFKFWSFGVNLIGFEHGHSINPTRMAALMANETRTTHWANARYCEWHCGDQHRKGTGKPSTFEEQGVSIEYLPALTPPNEWHRLKAYNWQKRAGLWFVYDKEAGPKCRGQINIDSYTGEIMGYAA